MGKIYTALGLMSGTSVDGVDASIIKSDGNREYSPLFNRYFEYGDRIRQEILNLRAKILVPNHLIEHESEIKDIERELTLFHANAVKEILNITKVDLDLLGFHGQTIFHDSKKKITKQLGDGKLLSQLIKKKVVYDFRQNDLKNGGQGAPLTPIFHNLIANKYLKKELDKTYSVNFLNIGGISNLTKTVKWDKLDKKTEFIEACDIGPGNCLIDDWVRKNSKKRYDIDGTLASIGNTDRLILNQALENFNISPPFKDSLDIKDFDISFVKGLSLEDGVSTLADFTSLQISKAVNYFKDPTKKSIFLVCGGGRKNKYLMESILKSVDITQDLNKTNFVPVDDYGIDGDFVESQAFAYLAIRSLLNLPISFPNTTGCKESISGGKIIKNF
ncbi:anhydro-N-acetylmuramic acid kinase [Candidatus Pelagibacter sp.]|nr:anhydro-N-acetylmuramic acid kinase [Candidatus Pelagibacter sp.]